MDIERQGQGPEAEVDGAEQAFEALREEVAALRRGIELMYRQVQQGGPRGRAAAAVPEAPDYSPTLGVIAQELRAVGKRLDGIEEHPALRLTPAAYAQQVTTGVRQAQDESGRGLTHAQGRFSDGLGEMRRLIGSAHSQLAQQRREYVAAAIGAVLGFAVWWPLVFLTPWGGGHWLASTLIGGGRWGAGETLMREADPVVWDRLARLFKACPQDSTTELCEAAMAVRTVPPKPEAMQPDKPVAPVRPHKAKRQRSVTPPENQDPTQVIQ